MKTIALLGFGCYILQAELYDGGRRFISICQSRFPTCCLLLLLCWPPDTCLLSLALLGIVVGELNLLSNSLSTF